MGDGEGDEAAANGEKYDSRAGGTFKAAAAAAAVNES